MCDACEREYKMPFGQYQGEELSVIYLADKSYLRWCSENFEPCQAKSYIDDFLEEHDQ